LFKGYTFYVTASVKPERDVLERIVKSAGGEVFKEMFRLL
jgi:hypothetical protein